MAALRNQIAQVIDFFPQIQSCPAILKAAHRNALDKLCEIEMRQGKPTIFSIDRRWYGISRNGYVYAHSFDACVSLLLSCNGANIPLSDKSPRITLRVGEY